MTVRTAPTVDGSPQFKEVSVSWIDYSGQVRTDTVIADAASTDVQIEAYAAALVPTSNASMWQVSVADVYSSTPSQSNADEEVWEDVKANIVLLWKNPATKATVNTFIPSPANALFVDGTENIDINNAEFNTAYLATQALMLTGYNGVSARFSKRRDIGTRVKF